MIFKSEFTREISKTITKLTWIHNLRMRNERYRNASCNLISEKQISLTYWPALREFGTYQISAKRPFNHLLHNNAFDTFEMSCF